MATKDANSHSHKAASSNHKANSMVIEGLDRIEIVSEKPPRRSSSGLSGREGNHGGRKHSSASNGKRHSRSRSMQEDTGLPEGGGGGKLGEGGLSSRRKQQNEEEKEKQRRVSMAVGIGAAAIFLLAFLLIAVTLRMTPQIDEMRLQGCYPPIYLEVVRNSSHMKQEVAAITFKKDIGKN
ncbi:uncharacterized protein LOC143023517 [Oratosquilla oratoria]|uniref:uncharacterized protein LOC143023517 n=1 Tax=Oratosquilla oratoria TaxID=337810 RepID=UPI003F774A9D